MIRDPVTVVPEAADVAALLAEAGLPSQFRLIGLPGGANNRVYRVDCGPCSALLKAYFRHPGDPRDRLGAEFSFCRFAWDRGLRCLPRPLACDRDRGLGLYEFIEGRALAPGEVEIEQVEKAADFYGELNRHRADPAARALPRASEACFTLGEHLACVQRRLERLLRLDDTTPVDREAGLLVRRELAPAWDGIRDRALSQAAEWGLAADEPIPRCDERLSPSDFGFHNAILAADGRLRFIDFEYAGWDDPVKMICDFSCQPEIPVPVVGADHFARAAASDLSDPLWHLRRVSLLLNVYRVKWCCIMLNEFLPVDRQRRLFAQDARTEEGRKMAQLHKVGRALREIRR